MKNNAFYLTITLLVSFTLLIGGLSSFTIVRPGNVGVIFNSVTGSLSETGQGLVFKTPFLTSVQSYPVSLRTYTMVQKSNEGTAKDDDSLDLPTFEGQHIKQDLSITFNTNVGKAAEVFRTFKGASIEDIENTFIRRTVITVAQSVAGQMLLTEVISSKRDELQNRIQTRLSEELGKMGFFVDKVNLGASHLPESLEKQMQAKMAAQQEAQQASYENQKQQALAQAAISAAKGRAESVVIEARAQSEANKLLQQSVTPNLIEYERVKKWSGVLPTVTGGVVPFFNISKTNIGHEN